MGHEFHIARITLEACSPVMIAAGGDDPLHDVLLARDANGLPMLPATSLAGVLRHGFGPDEARELFGYQEGDDGNASRLVFTDALYHWSDDRPRDGIVYERTALESDKLAKLALRVGPVTRDHVRLNEYGVVDGHGKFERSAAPAGSRFTFEISERGDGSALKKVLEHLRKGLWLGGATRSGYGEMAAIRIGCETVDLKKKADRYRTLVMQNLGNRDIKMDPVKAGDGGTAWSFSGRIEGPLMIGAAPQKDDVDRSCYSEDRIRWYDLDTPCIERKTVIPASAIKGALRHRVLFHLHRLKHENPEAALERMFGCPADGAAGQAGSLRFSDIVLDEVTPFKMTHVGLDRFTGGSRRGVLFCDQSIWRPQLEFRITPLRDFGCDTCHNAFMAALLDLGTGRLGIGADWGDGAGVFESLSLPDELQGAIA